MYKYNVTPFWQRSYMILNALNRQKELQRLIQWAKKKNLSKPLHLYQNRLADEEKRLFRFAIQSRRSFAFAQFLSHFNRLINPTPRFLRKGSAKGYTYHSLTYPSKSHSISM